MLQFIFSLFIWNKSFVAIYEVVDVEEAFSEAFMFKMFVSWIKLHSLDSPASSVLPDFSAFSGQSATRWPSFLQ